MADWTANSNFGAFGRREPVVRASREAAPRAEGPRAERFGPFQPEEVAPPRAASAALAEYNAAQDGPLAKARIAVWAGGGIVSLALIAGIGVWGYKLVLREVMGLPVVIAEEGPMRLLPADPEGEVVPQQGLAVNAIPAAGIAAPPSDVLMLAPQTSGLAEEDLVVAQTTAEADEVMPAGVVPSVAAPESVETAPLAAAATAPAVVATEALAPAEAAPASRAVVAEPAPAAAADPTQADDTVATLRAALVPNDRPMSTDEVLAFADQIAGQARPLTTLTPAVIAEAAAPVTVEAAAPVAAPSDAVPAEAAPALALVPASVAGVAAAPRPQPRPIRAAAPTEAAPTVTVEAQEVASPSEAAPAAEAPVVEASTPAAVTASVPAGTHLIQLGAFDSAEIAASEWTRLQDQFGEFLGSRERVIQETQSGGRTFYRLRAQGFTDRADARRLCAALTAEGADCIPVTVD